MHEVCGVVQRGDGRGRSIGFATANLQHDDVQLPADGVYAVVARRLEQNRLLRGVANLGRDRRSVPGRSFEFISLILTGDLRRRVAGRFCGSRA
ncbi:MAG: riboflavin kinase [Polyangiales bacterium]